MNTPWGPGMNVCTLCPDHVPPSVTALRLVSMCTPCVTVCAAVCVHVPPYQCMLLHVSVCTPLCLCTPPTACQCVYTTVSVHTPTACLLVRPAPAPAAGPCAHLCWCSGRHFSLTLLSGPGSCVSGHRPRQAEPLSAGRTQHETCHHGRQALSRALSVPWTACVSLSLLTVHSLAPCPVCLG